MARVKITISAIIMLGLSACSIFEPYVDRRRNAGAPPQYLYVGRSSPTNPSICYNGLITDEQTVQQMADDECKKYKTGDHAEFLSEDIVSCKLLLPNRKTFTCVTTTENKDDSNIGTENK